MSDLVLLVLAPVGLSLVLVWLRAQRPTFWWLGLVCYCAAVTAFVLSRATDWRMMLGALLLYILPVLAMFLGLWPKIFLRRRFLIPPVGIALYLVGLALSLSINVSAGLIQP